MKKLCAITFGILVLLLVPASASAASDTKTYTDGQSASSGWNLGGDWGAANINVFKSSNSGTVIYVGANGYDANRVYYNFFGWATVPDDAATIDKQLDSASLSEVEVEVFDYTTYTYKTVTVKADWTAIGDLAKLKDTEKYKEGRIKTTYKGVHAWTDATATGSFIDFDDHELIRGSSNNDTSMTEYKEVSIVRELPPV